MIYFLLRQTSKPFLVVEVFWETDDRESIAVHPPESMRCRTQFPRLARPLEENRRTV
jgi:hypothetical protein